MTRKKMYPPDKNCLFRYLTYVIVLLYIVSTYNISLFYFSHAIAHQKLPQKLFQYLQHHHDHHHDHDDHKTTNHNEPNLHEHAAGYSHEHSFSFLLIENAETDKKDLPVSDNIKKLDKHKKQRPFNVNFNVCSLLQRPFQNHIFFHAISKVPPTPPPKQFGILNI